ncbi:hypothetical protein ACFTUC_17275 [Streptomyces sp. NPDC056944]|uniref:hypothetical protein n=1 Tax=Streptomyces sp. NPDC056944 TaxID=3345972 RepID=UPI0036324B7F
MSNEISYPFTSDSAGGGQQMVSQAQWQHLARLFAKDRVDYRLEAGNLDPLTLPFAASVVNGTSVSLAPGRALVGGFYYQLTASATVNIAPNSGATGRLDLIVLRASLATSSVNLAVVQGQPAATPKAPALTRSYGGVWEMPLYQVTVPANGGALSLIGVAPHDYPDVMSAPWNALNTASYQPVGSWVIDMDSNNTDTETEYFVGRDATAATRDLGKTRTYTPSLVNVVTDVPSINRVGHWRWIAPGMVYLSICITCDWEDQGTALQAGKTVLGFSLPQPASGATGQVLKGYIRNPNNGGGLPNLIDITAVTGKSTAGQTVASMYFPSPTILAEGLDSLRTLPSMSTLTVSGVYEASTFGN